MTEEPNLEIAELAEKNNVVKIYSKKAILGFSIFFSPVFGGVLLRQNLIDCKKNKQADAVLVVSILFTVLTVVIVDILEKRSSSLTYGLNLVGGVVLSEYFFKKYFPDDNYKYKTIWKALLISLAITIPLVLALIYFPTE